MPRWLPRLLRPKDEANAGEKSILHRWSVELEGISGTLANCIGDKESVFLEIGQKIREFSSRSRVLSNRAASLTETVSGEEMRRDAAELESNLHELRSLGEEEDGLNKRLHTSLWDLDSELRQLLEDMNTFRPLIKQLRMLSLYIRIESAGMGSSGGGFVNLAGQIEDLARSTESHIGDIERRANQAGKTVSGARDMMKGARGTARVKTALQGLDEACGEFTAMRERAGRMSDSLDERTNAIVARVDDVVSSVQFHDITRQQVEHITQVLSEVATMLVEDSAEKEEMTGWVGEVCSLQDRQIASTHREFAQATTRIRESLSQIAERIRGIEESIQSLSQGGEDDHGSTVLERIRERADALVDPMREALSFWSEVRDGMDNTGDQVRGMERFVDQVEAISEEIKFIALNASIHAAHTGEQGQSMGVLAEAVRGLSSEAGELTQRTGDRLQRIVRHADSLRSEAERARELSQREGGLIGDLEEVVQRLQAKETEIASGLDWLSRESANLAATIEGVDAGASLEEEVGAELESARQSLRKIKEQSNEIAGGRETDQAARSERLQEILQRYTMESERLVHMAFAGTGTQEEVRTESEEEAASGMASDSGETREEAEETEDLGDNVELF